MKNLKFDFSSVVNYIPITCAAHIVGFVIQLLGSTFAQDLAAGLFIRNFISIFTLCCTLIVPYGILFFVLKKKLPEHYAPEDGKLLWLKSGLFYMLPGEIVRLVINMLPVPALHFGVIFGMPAYQLYFSTYAVWSGRYWEIRSEPSSADTMAFLICYLVYLVIHMAIMTAIYYYFWRKARKEHQQWMETRKTQSEY